MKKYKIIFILIILSHKLYSQVIITDSVFLQALIEKGVDTNQDGQIQLNEAESITTLEIEFKDIYSISGIEAFSNLRVIKFGHTLLDSADLTNNLLLQNINLADNELTGLQLPILPQLTRLVLRNNELSSINLSGFTQLEELDLENNNLSSLNLSNLTNLINIDLDKNILESIDFTENIKLRNINISNNNFTSIDVKHLKELSGLTIAECPIQTLDVAGLENLFTLWITGSSIQNIFMRGTSPDQTQLQFDGAPLKYICADESYISAVNEELENENITDCLVTTFCPITDEGVIGGISGSVKIGQTIADCYISLNNLANPKFETTYFDQNGQHNGVLIGRQDGSYDINFYGTMTLTPAMTYANEWQYILPEFTASNYSSDPQNYVQNFCIVPGSDVLRTELNIIPLQEFRAGFESEVLILIRNTGTLPFSGTLALNIPQDSLNYVTSNSNPAIIEPGSITWPIQDLQPFNEFKIKTTLRLNSPMDTPPLFGNEDIQLCAELTDLDQYRNNVCINDLSVNSFDPNDKTYLGKDTLTINQILAVERLSYLIRFENTGSAEAINIVISDKLDEQYILPNSIRIIESSHDVSLEMEEDGAANFIFRNINLPFELGSNRGFVLFSVEAKTENIAVDDQIDNNAEIYFDFNYPIITNEASIYIINETSSSSFSLNPEKNSINIFPNPSTGNFTVQSNLDRNKIKRIDCIDTNGKINRNSNVNSDQYSFSDFASGIYLLRITTENFTQIHKVIIKGN